MNNCSKCNGTGQYAHYGVCFRCGGTGKFAPGRKKGSKFKVGDRIRHNLTMQIFEIQEVDSRKYKAHKYSSDGETLLSDKSHLAKSIDNYPEGSKEGYTLLNDSRRNIQ